MTKPKNPAYQMKFTDSHCHLDFSELSSTISQLIDLCKARDIHRLIVPSVGPNNWEHVLNICELSTDRLRLLPAIGIHPWYLNDLDDTALTVLDHTLSAHKEKLVAIGETGIDGKIAEEFNNMAKQCYFFESYVTFANEHHLPLIIHHRKSHAELVPILKRMRPKSYGVIHGFSGSYQQAKQYLDLGFKLGIGGTISYERAKKTINTVKKLPLDSILLETDAPSMPLSGFQGEPNSPLKLVNVFELLVSYRQESAQDIAEQIEKNVDILFNNIN